MGWGQQEEGRVVTRREDVGRNALSISRFAMLRSSILKKETFLHSVAQWLLIIKT